MEHVLAPEEARLVEGLRNGDEAVFTALMREYGASMLRVAQMYVSSRSVAEEVVADTWLAIFNGIGRFEGRSSLKTWIFRILVNTAKTRGAREARSIPFSALASDDDESAVDPDRFLGPDDRFAGHWSAPPLSWSGGLEALLAEETLDVIRRAVDALPPNQRLVITMRDIEGFDAEEVRNALELSETNQRVLLHRARAKVRQALEDYLQ